MDEVIVKVLTIFVLFVFVWTQFDYELWSRLPEHFLSPLIFSPNFLMSPAADEFNTTILHFQPIYTLLMRWHFDSLTCWPVVQGATTVRVTCFTCIPQTPELVRSNFKYDTHSVSWNKFWWIPAWTSVTYTFDYVYISYGNEWCIGGHTGQKTTTGINYLMNHATGAGLIVRPVDLQSNALQLCYGCNHTIHMATRVGWYI